MARGVLSCRLMVGPPVRLFQFDFLLVFSKSTPCPGAETFAVDAKVVLRMRFPYRSVRLACLLEPFRDALADGTHRNYADKKRP